MRITRIFLFLSLLLAWTFASAQVSISASHVADAFERPITNAKLCFAPVDAASNPAGFRVGSVQVVPGAVCGLINNGVLQSGLSVAPSPAGLYYHLWAASRNNNAVIRDFGMAPITGSSWTLDTYDPAIVTVPASALTMGSITTLPPGSNASCNLTGGNPYALNCAIPQAPGATEVSPSTQYTIPTYDSNSDLLHLGPSQITTDANGDLAVPNNLSAGSANIAGLFAGFVNGSTSITSPLIQGKLIGSMYQVDQFGTGSFDQLINACITYGGIYGQPNLASNAVGNFTCDARRLTASSNGPNTLTAQGDITVTNSGVHVLLPCQGINFGAHHIIVKNTSTYNVGSDVFEGCGQDNTTLTFTGSDVFIQVGDSSYTYNTMRVGFRHLAINTGTGTGNGTAAAFYRTQDINLEDVEFNGNGGQTGLTLDGTGNYTGGDFTDVHIVGYLTALNMTGHQSGSIQGDFANASHFTRLHINCGVGGTGIWAAAADGNNWSGGDIENCVTMLYLGPNAVNNTFSGVRNEGSTYQIQAAKGSQYNKWTAGGALFIGAVSDLGTHNDFEDAYHNTHNGITGDWQASLIDSTITNHYRLGIGNGFERGIATEYQTDFGYRWTVGLTDGATGLQNYYIQDLLNNVPRLTIGQYLSSQSNAVAGGVVQHGGSFQSAPAILITGGSGSGAAATPVMTASNPGAVYSVAITNAGNCSQGGNNVFSLTFTGGGGSGAAGYVYTSTTAGVTSVVMTNGGYGYTSAPTVTLSTNGCTATAFTATIASSGGNLASLTLSSGGTGYGQNTWQPATITGGGGTGAVVYGWSGTNGAISMVSILNQGTGYTSAPAITFPTSGTQANVTAAVGGPNISISTVTMTANGSGYTAQPAFAFSGGGGCAPQFNVTISSGAITAIGVPYGGCGFNHSDYAALYIVGDGTGAAAVVNSQQYGSISSVTVTNGGSGYTTATVYVQDNPTGTIGGSYAAVNAIISGTGSTNNQTALNAAGNGLVCFNCSNNSGTGGIAVSSGGTTPTTVASVDGSGNTTLQGVLNVMGVTTHYGNVKAMNNLDAEIDFILQAGATASQKESLTYKDYTGSSQWYMLKNQYNDWALNSAVGNLDSFKAYQSTNSGDTYVNASNSTGHVRINVETGAGTETDIYNGGSSPTVIAAFAGLTSIKFPGLAAGSGHNCLQIDNSGYITNTGSACGTGSLSVVDLTTNVTNQLPIANGGTGSNMAAGALSNLGGVPTTRNVNGHPLSADVSVTAADTGAVAKTNTLGCLDGWDHLPCTVYVQGAVSESTQSGTYATVYTTAAAGVYRINGYTYGTSCGTTTSGSYTATLYAKVQQNGGQSGYGYSVASAQVGSTGGACSSGTNTSVVANVASGVAIQTETLTTGTLSSGTATWSRAVQIERLQ